MGSSGWNKPSANQPTVKKGGAKAPNLGKGILAGLVCVVIALGVLYFLRDVEKPAAKNNGKRPAKIAEVEPAAAKQQEKADGKKARMNRVKSLLSTQVVDFVKHSTTNGVRWAASPLPPDDPDNILYTKVAKDIAALLAVEPGDPVPPILPLSFMFGSELDSAVKKAKGGVVTYDGGNAKFLADLKKWKVTIKEADSALMADHKQKLVDVQLDLLKGIDDGVTVEDSIRAAYDFRVKAAETRKEMVEMLKELHGQEGSTVEDTVNLIKHANKDLHEQGIKRIRPSEVIPHYEKPAKAEAPADPSAETHVMEKPVETKAEPQQGEMTDEQ